MKNGINAGLLILLGACGGGGECGDAIVKGTWKLDGDATQSVTFTDTCKFADVQCSATGTYPNVTATSGSVGITITSTNNSNSCLPVGATTCTYAIDGTSLDFNCGGGDRAYTKQ